MVRFLGISKERFLEDYRWLYHYLSVDHLDQCLAENTHRFMNPMKWKDPYERYFLNPKYALKGSRVAPNYLPVRNKVFCKCFTSQYQCEPYWNRHPDNKTVCLKFDGAKLVERLEALEDYDVYIGKVKYVANSAFSSPTPDNIDFNEIFFRESSRKKEERRALELQLRLLLLKRLAFNYEKEIRIFLLPKSTHSATDHVDVRLRGAARTLIGSLTFAPTLRVNGPKKVSDKYLAYKEKYEGVFGIKCYLSTLLWETKRTNRDDTVIYF